MLNCASNIEVVRHAWLCQGFHFYLRQQMCQQKQPNLTNGHRGYFNLQAENTTYFNSISEDDKDRQSVNNENASD
jgi:hypothetical protein